MDGWVAGWMVGWEADWILPAMYLKRHNEKNKNLNDKTIFICLHINNNTTHLIVENLKLNDTTTKCLQVARKMLIKPSHQYWAG